MSAFFVDLDLAKYGKTTKKKSGNSWNCMQFKGCEVLNIGTTQYSCGERMSIEICAPKFKKRYYLFVWEEDPGFAAIKKSGLKKGDRISVYTELGYYRSDKNDFQASFQIVPNMHFHGTESPDFFKFMYVEREDVQKEEKKESPFLSKEDLLKKMMG